jgi:hypothetical protein
MVYDGRSLGRVLLTGLSISHLPRRSLPPGGGPVVPGADQADTHEVWLGPYSRLTIARSGRSTTSAAPGEVYFDEASGLLTRPCYNSLPLDAFPCRSTTRLS